MLFQILSLMLFPTFFFFSFLTYSALDYELWSILLTIIRIIYTNCELQLCRYHAIHSEVYKWFNISFDKFGRTSTPQQTEVCQAIFKKLLENKWLLENTMQQV